MSSGATYAVRRRRTRPRAISLALTKISRIDGLPFFLTHGALRARGRNFQMTVQRRHWNIFRQSLNVPSCVVGSSSELQSCFLNKICWTLSKELRIIGSLRARQTAKFSIGLTRAGISMELHCKGKIFAEKSR